MTGRSVFLLAALAGQGAAQTGRHPQPGVFVEAGGGISMVEADARFGPQLRPAWGVGVGWVSLAGPALSIHLEGVRYSFEDSFESSLIHVAVQPVWFVDCRPYTALYVGGRALLGWRRTTFSADFRDPTAAAGAGFGLVAGARSQAGRVIGFDARAAGNFLWFGDERAGGLRVTGTRARAFRLELHVALTVSPR